MFQQQQQLLCCLLLYSRTRRVRLCDAFCCRPLSLHLLPFILPIYSRSLIGKVKLSTVSLANFSSSSPCCPSNWNRRNNIWLEDRSTLLIRFYFFLSYSFLCSSPVRSISGLFFIPLAYRWRSETVAAVLSCRPPDGIASHRLANVCNKLRLGRWNPVTVSEFGFNVFIRTHEHTNNGQ